MRKTDIYISSLRISRAVEESGVGNLFSGFLHAGQKTPEPADVLEAFRKYTLAAKDFGSNEAKILETFKLDCLSAPEFWANVISRSSDKRKEMIEVVAESWRLFSELLPRLIALITPEKNIFEALQDGKDAAESGYVDLLLLESSEAGSLPERISQLMLTTRELHRAVCEVYEIEAGELVVVFCDSGSTKEFIFSTSKVAAKYLRDLLKTAIEELLYHKERKLEKRIKLVANSIPVLEAIEARKATLGVAKARLLENVIMEGITQFLEIGAIPRGSVPLEQATKILAPPRRKLLTHREDKNPTSD
jgi:hypothetical protein